MASYPDFGWRHEKKWPRMPHERLVKPVAFPESAPQMSRYSGFM